MNGQNIDEQRHPLQAYQTTPKRGLSPPETSPGVLSCQWTRFCGLAAASENVAAEANGPPLC